MDMVCIYCNGDTHVINSRPQKRNNQIWRRRECKECRATFTTHESVELSGALLVRKEDVTPFLADILFVDLLGALSGRSGRHADARELTTTVIARLLKQKEMVYESATISKEAAEVLKRFDRQAYLRYVAEHPSLQ